MRKGFSAEEISIFCEQLGMIVKAGIPLEEGLRIMQEEVQDEEIDLVLKQLEQALEDGKSFCIALMETKAFPDYMTRMIKLGFEAGRLEEVVGLLEIYYRRESEISQSIRRVLFYPLILLGMMCTVILVISTQVLPVFEEVLESLGMQMSENAMGMMRVGTTITEWSIVGILTILVGGLGVWGWMKVTGKQIHRDKVFYRFKNYEQFELQKFTSALALLIGSGVQPEYAVEMARELVHHHKVIEKIDKSLARMNEGQSLSQAMQESQLFSSLAVRMLIVGNRTGCLEEMMSKLAVHYEEEVEESLDRMVRRIEPVAVTILAIVIGSILLSVMLPLMSIMSVIG